MAGQIGWLDKLLKAEPDRAERRSVSDFAAYRWTHSGLRQDAVKNVSSTGVYLVTEERWQPGTILTLTLQREGQVELSSQYRITTQARVARSGRDGVGLSFVLAQDPESVRWEGLIEGLIEQFKPDDMLNLVRIVAAVTFLRRICPDGSEEIDQLLRGRLSNHRVAKAINIALKADELLASDPQAEWIRAQLDVVVRILEDGTTTDEDWLLQYWSGLLVTSCSLNPRDESNLPFVELFSSLTTIPLRILTIACTSAAKVLSETGEISAGPLACTLDELAATTGSRILHMERDLDSLSELGLIENKKSSGPTLLQSDEIRIIPTKLGLQLFARCKGHRGSLQEFFAVDSLVA
jgi:hypothetical protein